MSMTTNTESSISIPGMSSHFLDPTEPRDQGQGRLRYLTGGSGAPLILLHTVRTQAEHFRHLIPLIQQNYTVYALDLPGMGYSQIVPGASYQEPAMRAAVKRLVTHLDLRDVTLLGESIGAVLALTTAADLPDRIRRVVAVNPYDYSGGIARSSLLARLILTGVIAPGVGPLLAPVEPKPVIRAILTGGLSDPAALREDYLDELLEVVPAGPATLPSPAPCTATCPASSRRAPATPRSPHPSTSSTGTRTGPGPPTAKPTGPCSPTPNSRNSRTPATSSPWNDPTCRPTC